MDAREVVRARYPQAEARLQPPIYHEGERRPVREAYWGIAPSAGAGTRLIARGETEAEAWERAAVIVRAEED